MSIKSVIKKILGPHALESLKQARGALQYMQTSLPGHAARFALHSEKWLEPVVYSLPDKHVFFGYYDIQQLNRAQDKMLVTVIPRKANPKNDVAELKWVDLTTGQYHDIAQTRAWCWQQGSRLRWHPSNENLVCFNDMRSGSYVMCLYDLQQKKEVSVFPRAMYDITPDFHYGLSLNYSRLQSMRPGYGYSTLLDDTYNEKVPENDGIFLVDLVSNEEKLVFSYQQLVALTPEAAGAWNYINHISIAPDGSRFVFFHLWTSQSKERWKAKLYTAKIDGSELTCLEKEYITSHYCWKNTNELLTTTSGFQESGTRYIMYNIAEGTRSILTSDHLKHDGHPTCLNDGQRFITDTYPLQGFMQHVFCDAIVGSAYEPVFDIYSDPRMFGEKRCDLHPRLTKDGKCLTIDTTCEEGKRSVWLFRRDV